MRVLFPFRHQKEFAPGWVTRDPHPVAQTVRQLRREGFRRGSLPHRRAQHAAIFIKRSNLKQCDGFFFFDFIISGCALFWLSVSFWLMSLRPVAILIQVFFIDYPTEFHPWKVNKTQFSTQIVIFENQSLGSQISAFQKTKLKYGIRDWHSKPISKKTHEMD